MVRVTRRPSETIVSFRETDLIGSIVVGIVAIPCLLGVFVWGHPLGWAATGMTALALSTLHTRFRVGDQLWTERRVLGIPFQRRQWSRGVKLTFWDDWDLMCPFVLTLEDGGEQFDLLVSEARADIIRDEVKRAIRRHAASAYREPA